MSPHRRLTLIRTPPRLVARFLRCRTGASIVEYALLLAMISVGALVAFEALQGDIDTFYGSVGTKIESKNAK